MTLLYTTWAQVVLPMEKRSLNAQMIINEYLLLALCYVSLGFSQVAHDTYTIFQLGYVFLAFLSLLIFINVCIVAWSLFVKLR